MTHDVRKLIAKAEKFKAEASPELIADIDPESVVGLWLATAEVLASIFSSSNTDLDVVEARANAATPGPWRQGYLWDGEYWVDGDAETGSVKIGDMVVPLGYRPTAPHYADAHFVARSREDVPALVNEVRALRATLATVTGNTDVESENSPS